MEISSNHYVLLLGGFKTLFLYLLNFQLQTEIGHQLRCRKMEKKIYKISAMLNATEKIFSKVFNITCITLGEEI